MKRMIKEIINLMKNWRKMKKKENKTKIIKKKNKKM
jgi:hypothetical protein